MDHIYIDECQVAERYVLGKLPPEEAAAFEEHSLACPECLERLELAEAMRRGLRTVAAREVAAGAVRLGLLARLVRSRFAPLAVMALLLVAVLPSGLLLQRADRLEDELERTRLEVAALAEARQEPAPPPAAEPGPPDADAEQERRRLEGWVEELRRERERLAGELEQARRPRANVPLLTLSPERSAPGEAEPSVQVPLAPEAEWVVLSLDLAGLGFPDYRAALVGPGGRTLWREEGLRPDATGFLNVGLPTSLLSPGDFMIRLEGLPAEGEPVPTASFSFRTVR
jgi:hypothetical protein